MAAAQAAPTAMHTALKKKGLRDDITILVVDLCASADDRLPEPLKAGYRTAIVEHIQMWRPLEASSVAWRCDPPNCRLCTALPAFWCT